MSIRPVKRAIQLKPTLECAGVHLRRALDICWPAWTYSGKAWSRKCWLNLTEIAALGPCTVPISLWFT